MIEKTTFDGKDVIVAFFDDNFETCEEADATMVKIIFLDDGSNQFMSIDAYRMVSEEPA